MLNQVFPSLTEGCLSARHDSERTTGSNSPVEKAPNETRVALNCWRFNLGVNLFWSTQSVKWKTLRCFAGHRRFFDAFVDAKAAALLGKKALRHVVTVTRQMKKTATLASRW